MVQLPIKDPLVFINQFSPLNQVAKTYHPQLKQHMHLQQVAKGKTIVRKSSSQQLLHFLVSGRVEFRISFDHRLEVDASNSMNQQSLESSTRENTTVKALEDCVVLVVKRDQLDLLLINKEEYAINFLDNGELSLAGDDLIDDNYQEDWDNNFILSSLATHLPNTVIHQLFSQLENIAVSKGNTIIKANSPGDYFYIIKTGSAIVETEINGPFKGEIFTLSPGNYFGDEALVAETPRNANVTMASDGVLGRLGIEAFNQLVKPNLISTLDQHTTVNPQTMQVLDVRFAAEYQQGHTVGSVNMPISFLRQQLSTMKSSLLYLITPANDRRAELATYIMRQAGYRAYLQADTLP